MLSEHEKDRLMAQMQSELGASARVVLKCGACLLLIVGLAVIGARTSVDPGGNAVAARYGEAESLQHARKAYAERQARFEKHLPGRGATPGVVADASARESDPGRD